MTAKVEKRPKLIKTGDLYLLSVPVIEEKGFYDSDGNWYNQNNYFMLYQNFKKKDLAIRNARIFTPLTYFSFHLELFNKKETDGSSGYQLIIKNFDDISSDKTKPKDLKSSTNNPNDNDLSNDK